MSEQDQTKMVRVGKKNRYPFNNRENKTKKPSHKSKIAKLKDEIFDFGAVSNPSKFSKSLTSIENYIQMNNKTCNNIVKAIQKLKRPTLNYPKQPMRLSYANASRNVDKDEFEMARFAFKGDYK